MNVQLVSCKEKFLSEINIVISPNFFFTLPVPVVFMLLLFLAVLLSRPLSNLNINLKNYRVVHYFITRFEHILCKNQNPQKCFSFCTQNRLFFNCFQLHYFSGSNVWKILRGLLNYGGKFFFSTNSFCRILVQIMEGQHRLSYCKLP